MFLIALGLITVSPRLLASQSHQVATTIKMMCGGTMGGHGEDMQIVHQLFANHDQIRRSVEEIPGGFQNTA